MALLLNAGDTVSRSYSYTQPSPLHPSIPQGTGERTGNLAKYWKPAYVSSDGLVKENRVNGVSFPVKLEASQTVSFTNQKPNFGRGIAIFSEFDGETLTNLIYRSTNNAVTYTADSACYVIIWGNYDNTTSMDETVFNLCGQMLNLGSTALPYEPYGYKIPISSANTTTPVYLGEVETERKIKKLVLTGEENVSYNTKNDNRGRFGVTVPISITGTSVPDNVISSHLPTLNSTDLILLQTGICMRSTATSVVIAMSYREVGITSPSDAPTIVDAVKAYLAQQYATGTPVTVWYVLATEETAVVNDLLMRIGDYADTLSGISIPVTAGGDTLSVGTTLQPSEVTVNYKGWHPVTDVHERENGAWT